MRQFLQDVRYTLRTLRRNPGFTLAVVSTLALGLGANTTVFMIIRGVVLKPLPYRDDSRIVTIGQTFESMGDRRFWLSGPRYRAIDEQNRSFDVTAAYQYAPFTLTGDGPAELLSGFRVTGDFFEVLGVEPVLGRTIQPDDDRPGAERVVVLDYDLWQRRFGGSPEALGDAVLLGNERHTVIGVMPPNFWPQQSLFVALAQDLGAADRNRKPFSVLARLAPGVSLEAAQRDLRDLDARWVEAYPDVDVGPSVADPLRDSKTGDVRRGLYVLQGAVTLILLMACANVANLLLARMKLRGREIALRTALGAGAGRLCRQLTTESLVLATGGGALGLIVAWWAALVGAPTLIRLLPNHPNAPTVSLDGGVLLFALVISFSTSLITGVLPSVKALSANLVDGLREGARGQAGGRRSRASSALILVEVALAVVLLAGAGLLARSFARLSAIDPGFDYENLVVARLSLPETKYVDPVEQVLFYRRLLERLSSLPGAESAGLVDPVPLLGGGSVQLFTMDGQPAFAVRGAPGEVPSARFSYASPDSFETMGITVQRGRTFDAQDDLDAVGVVVINESAAQTFWPGKNPIGERISLDDPDGGDAKWWTIVGIVGDVHQGDLTQAAEPEIYRSYYQNPERRAALVLRTAGDPVAASRLVRKDVAAMDVDVPVSRVLTGRRIVDNALYPSRFNAVLLGLFAGIALALAAVGVFGLVKYFVSQSRAEVAIRQALGAGRGDVFAYVFRQGLMPAAAGIALGLVAALGMRRFLSHLVYGIGTLDPATFIVVVVLLVVVTGGACLVPALKAVRISPMETLRGE